MPAPPEEKLTILVSPEKAPLLLKAAKEISAKEDHGTEATNDFARQNSASKTLVEEANKVIDQALESLVKEVKELLGADSK